MKRFVMIVALTCALSGVALAGEMPISGIAPPASAEQSIARTVVLALISCCLAKCLLSRGSEKLPCGRSSGSVS